MKAQIINQEVAGRHNSDLAKSTSRVMRGGSWKKQRVVMVIPAAESIPSRVYLSHCSLMFPPNQGAHRMLALGMEVGEAYSQAIESILAHPDLGQWEFVLTVEHDNAPPPDGLLKLIAQMEAHPEFAAIGGLYWTKGEGGVAQVWGDPADPLLNFRPQPPQAGKLVECNGTGMGFTLWRLQMFRDERLRKPWFKTHVTPTGASTQDLYAWGDFRKHGYRCAVDCDVRVGHYSASDDVMW